MYSQPFISTGHLCVCVRVCVCVCVCVCVDLLFPSRKARAWHSTILVTSICGTDEATLARVRNRSLVALLPGARLFVAYNVVKVIRCSETGALADVHR